MENTHQDKRSRKLPGIRQFLQIVHKEFQSYSKTSQRTQRKKRVEMGRRTTENFWWIKGQNNKSTSSRSSKERRKILSKDRCIRTCHSRSSFTKTRRQMETHCIFVKNNTTSRTKLWDLWQRIIGNCGIHHKIEIIFIRCHRKIRSLDRSWKSQVISRTT